MLEVWLVISSARLFVRVFSKDLEAEQIYTEVNQTLRYIFHLTFPYIFPWKVSKKAFFPPPPFLNFACQLHRKREKKLQEHFIA